ncbi:MAG TPA: FAD-dependent oxidoreductase [Gemmatimonadaceae bacterium]|nr:FAD-dependent oxidoreductase [Gemmatimonadaceae bacterium]
MSDDACAPAGVRPQALPPEEAVARLYSGAPYWLMRDGRGHMGSPLLGDYSCDVAIVGAGMTGAFIADTLSMAGLRVIVLERDEPALGTTGCSTALLQYELDVELAELMTRIGEADAVRAYHLCLESLAILEHVALTLGGCGFRRKGSLYLARRPAHTRRLAREAELRRTHGLPADFMDTEEVRRTFGLECHGAIRCSVAAEVDPVRLTRRLLERACRHGARLATRTAVLGSEPAGFGIVLHTARRTRVRCSWIVYASGADAEVREFGQERHPLVNSFAIATDRLTSMPAWLPHTILWESSRPYAYLRTTDDRRIILGGEDAPYRGAASRDRMLAVRVGRLEQRLRDILPALRCRTAFAWAGTMTETPDGLPCIGSSAGAPGVIHAHACGANGNSFGALAARIVRDIVLERPNDYARLFSPDRDAPRRTATAGGGHRSVDRPAATTRD